MAWFRRSRPLRWAVVVAAPPGDSGAQWGDTWFAGDLVAALRRADQQAEVVFRGEVAQRTAGCDVVLVLRGLRRIRRRRDDATWMLWVISHPELVESDEPVEYDATFAASQNWSRNDEFGVEITPLLQATDARRFTPDAAPVDSGAPILFVGSTRGEFRPVIRDSIDLGVTVYGVGWDAFLPPEQIAGEFMDNADLPAAYASAGVVLNDHWPDMAAEGFLSNRLFDAAACAARIVTDPVVGLERVFAAVPRVYHGRDELREILLSGPDAFASRAERIDLAERIAIDHSLDARVRDLLERAKSLQGRRR